MYLVAEKHLRQINNSAYPFLSAVFVAALHLRLGSLCGSGLVAQPELSALKSLNDVEIPVRVSQIRLQTERTVLAKTVGQTAILYTVLKLAGY